MGDVPLTVGQVRRAAARRLTRAGSATPALDARLILQRVLGLTGAGLLARDGEVMASSSRDAVDGLLRRREAGEPVAHLTGTREFWGLDFQVTPDVLIPRADTESLLDAALGILPYKDEAVWVADLGTGSGCLLIGCLMERPSAQGVGLDRSAAALAVARRNACSHGVDDRALFVQGDWASPLRGGFDLVLANPPYIPSADIDGLPTDVRAFEPHLALDGGRDGLCALEAILDALLTLLGPHGRAVLEFGFDQRAGVAGLIAARPGLEVEDFLSDLAGHDRGVVVRRRS
ncbi:MAG: peptide chain release factor N(5)-glutamine methyltransferase [Alphaproteobacteria bacterium]